MVNGPKCAGCPLQSTGGTFIKSPSNSGTILILLDQAGEWDSREGLWIQRQLRRLGLSQERIVLSSTLRCSGLPQKMLDHPYKFPIVNQAREHCRGYLDDLISNVSPVVIVAAGDQSILATQSRFSAEQVRNYTVGSNYGIPVVCTFSPIHIQQGNHNLTGAFLLALQKAVGIAGGKSWAPPAYDLLLDPSPSAAQEYLDQPTDTIVCDIETRESPTLESEEDDTDVSWDIFRVSFSLKRGTGLSIPFCPPYNELVRNCLTRPEHKVFWNEAFDVPRLTNVGCLVLGEVTDAMWGWHFLQSDLPRGLSFAAAHLSLASPWKHLNSSHAALYSAMDSAITMDCYIEIKRQLIAEGRWDEFERQCTHLLPHLKGMQQAGLKIDAAHQHQFLDVKLKGEADAILTNIQPKIPDSVRNTKLYKRLGPKHELQQGEKYIPNPSGLGGTLFLPFNPGSPLQRKRLFKALGLKVPRDHKKDRDTIQSKHLRKYSKKFPVLGDIYEYSLRNKLITAYHWSLDDRSRVHPLFGFAPSTWRKNCRNPNVQTIPKRSDLAREFRRMFIAEPGSVLIECDSSAIEAVLVGYFAGSTRYIDLAKRGVHKWLAEKYAGRPVSKSEPLYNQIKQVVHLSNYLGSPNRILDENPEYFGRLKEARELQEFYFDTPEGKDVRRWQESTIARAAGDHYLQTPFGQRHYFWDAVSQRNGHMVAGSDAKKAVAFLPQASASAIQTHYVLSLDPWMFPYLRAIVHDSIIAEVPSAEVGNFTHRLVEVMSAPIKELGGLAIGCECKVGENLAEMESV